MVHKTKAIILRSIKYGESSIICSAYTSKFGLQAYLIKGIRKGTKKSAGNSNYFQPGALLQMEVYHNPLKQLQYIKEYQWSFLYQTIYASVIKNAMIQFMVELILKTCREPESNSTLFDLIEECFIKTDQHNQNEVANIPLYFILQLSKILGFQLNGNFDKVHNMLDLKEGIFINDIPSHSWFIIEEDAEITYKILNMTNIDQLKNISLNRIRRRNLLQAYQTFLSLHIEGFTEIKSFAVLQQIL